MQACSEQNHNYRATITQLKTEAIAKNRETEEMKRQWQSQLRNLREEVDQLWAENATLTQQTPQLSESSINLVTYDSADLAPLREQVLAQLKLGKQAPGYKAAAKALDRFIHQLRGEGDG